MKGATRGALLFAGFLVLVVTPAAPALAAEEVTIEIVPTDATVVLGQSIDIEVRVTNPGATPSSALVAHIDVTDLTDSASVDPEDWTPSLSRPIGVVDAGATETLTWSIQPIAGGQFTLYAVALSGEVSTVAASDSVRVTVEDRRSLNPNGILPIAIAGPLLVGGVLFTRVWRNRGRRPTATIAR
jgi:hypothetical protein